MTDVPNLGNGEAEPTATVTEEGVTGNIPVFPEWLEIEYDGGRVQVGHENGESEAGFDFTSFGTAERFVKFLEDLDLNPCWNYVRVDASIASLSNASYYYTWSNEEVTIVCGNNPITGDYRDGEFKEKGYASYMGIEGSYDAVQRAYEAVEFHADHIKGRNRENRDFI